MLQKRMLFSAAAAALIALPAAAQPKVAANPLLPTYGQPVTIALDNAGDVYLPATRYSIDGSSIVIDYEYVSVGFGPWGPDFGHEPLSLGEIPPGNYTITARLHDIAAPANTAPKVVTGTLAVVPPGPWGLYTVPMQPQANADTRVLMKSAAYFDPKSMRASVSGNIVRMDFVYSASAPATGAAPDGMAAYGSVRIPTLPAGTYRLEGWGRTADGAPEKFFERDLVVAGTTPVVEYYSPGLDHYFMALGADEIALLDRGAQGDWKRTGYGFKAWGRAEYAAPGAVPVCRFYARGPNSHFFTANRAECDWLKSTEQQGRAQASAAGERFLGWGYEGIAFHALLPKGGQCPAGSAAVFRAYNHRSQQNDSNHRFTADDAQQLAMSVGWTDEGVAFCAPD